MPTFTYKARNKEGVRVFGEIDSENPYSASKLLKEQGLFVIQVKEKEREEKFKITLPFFGKISLKDKAIFTKELAVMIKAGLPIVSAIKSLSEQTENKNFKGVLKRVAVDVEGGKLLSEALDKHPDVFPKLYVNTIKSGEKGGKLEEVLESLSEQLEKEYDLNVKIRGAMVYPAFILVAMVVILIIIFIYVLPQLTKLFSELGGLLPWQTKLLMKASEFILKFWWLVLVVLVFAVSALRFWLKTKVGVLFFDKLKLRLPIFGSLFRKIYMARFCRSSSVLIKAGLPLMEVLKTVADVVANVIYQKDLLGAAKQVEMGLPLSTSLKQSTHFPSMVSHLITVGEASGNLEKVLEDLADYYDKEVDAMTKAMSSLIEPILIVLIGIVVAFVIISVIKPIYSITEML